MNTYPAVAVGDRIKFRQFKQRFTVKGVSSDGRFLVCTKPFAARHTTVYTIVDFELDIRGRDNFYGLGYETDQDCRRVTRQLGLGMVEVSHRHNVPLDIEQIERAT